MKKTGMLLMFGIMTVFLAGCQGRNQDAEEEKEVLTICADGWNDVGGLAEDWKKYCGGMEVEVIELSHNETADMKNTEIRTEIMSGGGPDVFVLACPVSENENISYLFSNPEKVMESDLFLPLDEYMENAEYMKPEQWNQTILEAGRTEDGQVLLPVYYRYCAYMIPQKDVQGVEQPASWEEVYTSENPALKSTLGNHMWSSSFPFLFGKLADYQKGELTFSKEELAACLDEALLFEESNTSTEESMKMGLTGWGDETFYSEVSASLEEEPVGFTLPNKDGGVTAMVTLYAAVNRNTEHPEEAFAFLDFMLSDEVTSGIGFKRDEKFYGSGGGKFLTEGITVNQKVFVDRYCRNDKAKEIYESINGRIDTVKYYSDMDEELYQLYGRYKYTQQQTEREELIQSTYDRMKMKVAE